MHRVQPNVYLIAATNVDDRELNRYLHRIGATDWESDAKSDIEETIEVMSRSCYKSFGLGLNDNITRVREGNKSYLANIIESGHGSVLEHTWASFMFTNVSRVFTHELVRHRAGTAISQESLRFVRLNDLGMWIPPCYKDNPKAVKIFERAWRQAEENYSELLSIEVLGDEMDNSRAWRQAEAARRVAPIGLSTNIGWSCNMRALRHVIEMRTDTAAEEEMRVVFGQVAMIAQEEWPNLFEDYVPALLKDETYHYKTLNKKV